MGSVDVSLPGSGVLLRGGDRVGRVLPDRLHVPDSALELLQRLFLPSLRPPLPR